MNLDSDTLTLTINSTIIETIIGELFFRDDKHLANKIADDDDKDHVNAIRKAALKQEKEKKNAMNLFMKKQHNVGNAKSYNVVIENLMWFNMTIDYVSTCMSFCQVTQFI